LHWEFNSAARWLKKIAIFTFVRRFAVAIFYYLQDMLNYYIFKSVPTRVCQDTLGTDLAMLNLSNLDAILCTIAHARIRKRGAYIYEHFLRTYVQ
jgi:hypothetical protein